MRVAERPDYDDRRADIITRGEAKQMMAEGRSLWDRFDKDRVKKKRESAVEGLEKMEQVTGISTVKHRNELEQFGEDPRLIDAKIQRMKMGGTKYLKNRLEDSGTFTAKGKFGKLLEKEKLQLLSDFSKLDLTEGDPNMVDVICKLDEMLKEKVKFMEEYNDAPDDIKDEFERQLPMLPFKGNSKKRLLEEIKAGYEGLEDAMNQAPAVRKAFKERSKKAGANKDTAKLSKEILKEFDELKDKYLGKLKDKMEVFGGEEVKDKDGSKWTLTAKEFKDWFLGQPSLAAMRGALRKLPKYINEREQLYEKRDELLEKAKPDDRKRFEKITKLMRRHELKKYIKDTLQPAIQSKGLLAAEYAGELITAREGGIDLYSPFEKAKNKSRFVTASPEEQEALIKVERIHTRERRAVVRRYLDLPNKVRNDIRFRDANHTDRESMLQKAEEKLNRKEGYDPFDIDENEILSDEQIHDMSDGLQSSSGENILRQVMAQHEAENAKQRLELQRNTWNRVGKMMKEVEYHNSTQKEKWSEDLSYWTKKPKHLKDIEDAPNQRMSDKVEFHHMAEDLWEKGIVAWSSGQMGNRQDITETDLEKGSLENIKRSHNEARYGTDIALLDAQGRATRTPVEMMKRVMSKTLDRYIPIILEDVVREMGLSQMASMGFIKSAKAANNVKHYVADELGLDQDLLAA